MWQNGLMEIERLTNNADIIAVATLADDAVVPIVWRDRRLGPPTDMSWELVLTSALVMYQLVRESVGHDGGFIRVIVGIHTVLVQREHGVSYGVVIETGHAIAKSLRRMIRKASKPASGERRAARAITGPPEPLQGVPTMEDADHLDDDEFAESIDDMAITERPL